MEKDSQMKEIKSLNQSPNRTKKWHNATIKQAKNNECLLKFKYIGELDKELSTHC
jgi:hypothetical protein